MFTHPIEKWEVCRNINEIGQDIYQKEACSISLELKI
jgi:hypothetical protein